MPTGYSGAKLTRPRAITNGEKKPQEQVVMVRRDLARKRGYPSGSRLSNPARVVAPALQTIERECHVRPSGHYRNYAKRCKVRNKVTDADVIKTV